MDMLQELAVEELLNSPAGQKIQQIMRTIAAVQQNLYALAASEDSGQLNLLKIATVFQIFLIDTLASKKDPKNIEEDEWRKIAEKVSEYAVLEKGQRYSEFVFGLYADYIELSANGISEVISEEAFTSISSISAEIRCKTIQLRTETITEAAYVEECLWLSLEAMIKLLSSSLTILIGKEFSQLAQAVSQLAFEYGRYVLYAKEQAILTAYVENQYELDELLHKQYEDFCAEVREQAKQFRKLIDDAFSPDIHNALRQSAALARAAGVKEEELLTSVQDVDAFFMD